MGDASGVKIDAKKESKKGVKQTPCILRLAGITMADYVPIEDVYEQRIQEEIEDETPKEPETAYDKIPRTFTSLDDWPLSTNLKCWDSDATFETRPVFMPTHMVDGGNGRSVFGVEGNFVSFPNVARYIVKHYTREEAEQKLSLLNIVYEIFTGHSTTYIAPAPPKEKKVQYGGEMSEEEYWEKIRLLDPRQEMQSRTMAGPVQTERKRVEKDIFGVKPHDDLLETNGDKVSAQRDKVSTWNLCRSSKSSSENFGETELFSLSSEPTFDINDVYAA